MVRVSSEILKKVKAMAILSAVLLSGITMSAISSIMNPGNRSSAGMDGMPGASYAEIGRPTFLAPGKYLNYSVRFGLVPGRVGQNSTNVTANLRYEFNSVAGSFYSITEQTTNLHVSYGHTNPERIMGFYNTAVSNATLLAEQYRGYSSYGPIRASILNLTNFGVDYSFSTTVNMYTINGSFAGATGNGTNQIIVDSKLSPSPAREYFFGFYKTILSYYKALGTLYRSPKALFTRVPGFTIDGTTTIETYMGTRSAVKILPVLNSTYTNLKWQDILYLDVYTGVLIKAVMYVDNSADGNRLHQLEYDLVGTNVDFGVPVPSPRNEFEDALRDIKAYLGSSALNDTNRSLFHHAAIGSAATPSNSTKLSSDVFKIIQGYSIAFDPLQMLFQEVNASMLRAPTGGFYTSMNAAGTVVDGIKTVTDAAWAIIGSSVLGSGAFDFQQQMFEYMRQKHYGNGTFAGGTFYAFARYNASDSTLDPYFYAYDNLIAFIALNWLAFNHNNVTVKSLAMNMAYRVISLFYSPGSGTFPSFWAPNSLFVTSIARSTGASATTIKSVRDAMLAIYCLSEYYLYNQTASAQGHVDRAIATFNILLNTAWNATNKGFIHAFDYNLNVINSNQFLSDNSWAMTASIYLLEAANKFYSTKKNITYYDVACDVWGAIKKVLYDSQNKTFRAASNDRSSKAGDLGELLFSLSEMLSVSRSTTLVVTTNASTGNKFIFENGKPAKATATWFLNMSRSFESPLQEVKTIIPLNYSDMYFKVRYANNSIYDEIFSVTNNNGVATFTFPLPSPPEFSDATDSTTAHVVGVLANRTGFEPKTALKSFLVVSGVSVWTDPKNPSARFKFSGDSFTAYFNNRTTPESVPSVYPGETVSVTINMSSTLLVAQQVNITFEGNIINRTSIIKTVNASAVNASFTLELVMKGDIPTGMQEISYSISKNGSAISAGDIPIYVKIPILLTNVRYAAYMVDESNYTLTFNVKNLNKNRNESVTIAFTSINLMVVGGPSTRNITNIKPDEEIPVSIIFTLKPGHALLNEYQFQFELSWLNLSLATLVYLIPFRQPVEVTSITGPTNPVQGSLKIFSVSLRNNLEMSTSVTVTILRVLPSGATTEIARQDCSLVTGVNNIIISCKDPLDNPWDIGNREYRVVVVHGSSPIGQETVVSIVGMSIENALFGYILVFGAFGVVFLLIFNKKRQIDSVRR